MDSCGGAVEGFDLGRLWCLVQGIMDDGMMVGGQIRIKITPLVNRFGDFFLGGGLKVGIWGGFP